VEIGQRINEAGKAVAVAVAVAVVVVAMAVVVVINIVSTLSRLVF
jgi:hypothetical protein